MKKYLNDSHFEILGVNKQSTNDEIKKAYRKQSMLWHPDKFSNDHAKWVEAHEIFIKIKEAYDLLKDYRPTESDNCNFRIRVKSTNIFAVGYDRANKVLKVEFRNGNVYEYYEVPHDIYIAFMNAESKGKFGKNYIFYKYKYKQVF